MFMVVRNEALRLPYLLKYYSDKGVDRFFIIDNGSTDGTIPFLLGQKNTHVFLTHESYGKSWCGNRWLRTALKRYGTGHWCLIVDADEILIYPDFEKISFKKLCTFLESEGSTALSSLLIDMYSDDSVRSATYKKGDDLLSAFPYFDGTRDDIRTLNEKDGTWYKGGTRMRVFGVETLLNKTSLIKYDPSVIVMPGQHSARNTSASAVIGATLHFKYVSEFTSAVQEEAKRQEHWGNAVEYKQMAKKVISEPDFKLFYEKSTRFKDSKQLVDLNLMSTTKEFQRFVEKTAP